jgi:type VI secretion system secreted protein VgrG
MDAPVFTQDNSLFTVHTSLGKDQLLFKNLQGEEQLSGLFHFQLELLSESRRINFQEILGKPLTVQIQFAPECTRYLNGIVTRFAQANTDTRFTTYYAEIRPWLWQLTLTQNCRIFQNLSVPDIIKQVFIDLGFDDYRFELIRHNYYEPRIYCVQYQETAFNFISRLMEDVGLFYFFEHHAERHVLVIIDDLSGHPPCPEIDTARFWRNRNETHPEDVITQCQWQQQLTTGRYAIDDFNFEIPQADLKSSIEALPEQKNTDLRVYEYDAGFSNFSQGQDKVTRRIESQVTEHKLLEGQGHCFSFVSGYRFTLTEHPREDFNISYVLRWISHSLSLTYYQNNFIAFPAELRFRKPRTTPRPQIVSTQTAIVTGPAGDEIYTDQYGRIKVQFHWDQEGKYDENSSCWIRVNQGWAGKGWGHIAIPRIGQEVIVSFLNGNPDTPIVTGAVYNALQTVPYPLPAEQTKSTLKSNSSKGGVGFNEIRFEDKKGQEQIFIHAERNQDIRVKKDAFEWIGEDRHLIINANQYELVKKDKSQLVEGDKFEKIVHDDNLRVGENQTTAVGKNYNLSVQGDAAVKVGLNQNMKVNLSFNLQVGGKISTQSKQSQQKVKEDYVLCAKSIEVGSGSTLKLSAKDTLTIEAGGSFITLNKDGIYLKGSKIYLNSGGSALESSQCEPKKPKPTCPPDPCTNPCQAGDALSGLKSALKNILESLDIDAGITPDGKYHLNVSGGYGPLKADGGISGDIKDGEFEYHGNASADTPYGEADGHISGDDDGNFYYGGNASGKVGPVGWDGGFAGDNHGNFSAWLNFGLHMADLLNQASQQGTPLIQMCEE